MKLYLLRHGVAAPAEGGPFSDAERPLTAEGKRKVRFVARAMRKRLEAGKPLLVSSPLIRARQTAEIVAEELKLRRAPVLWESLGDQDEEAILHALQSLDPIPESILLVGHEPSMSRTADRLIGVREGPGLALKKAGLCCLEAEQISEEGCARLLWLLTPKIMLHLAG